MQWKVVASGRAGATWQQLLLWWLLSPVTLRPLGQWPRRQLWLEKRPVLSCYLCVCGCSWRSVLQGFPSACSDGPWTFPPGSQQVVFEGVRGEKGFLVRFSFLNVSSSWSLHSCLMVSETHGLVSLLFPVCLISIHCDFQFLNKPSLKCLLTDTVKICVCLGHISCLVTSTIAVFKLFTILSLPSTGHVYTFFLVSRCRHTEFRFLFFCVQCQCSV